VKSKLISTQESASLDNAVKSQDYVVPFEDLMGAQLCKKFPSFQRQKKCICVKQGIKLYIHYSTIWLHKWPIN